MPTPKYQKLIPFEPFDQPPPGYILQDGYPFTEHGYIWVWDGVTPVEGSPAAQPAPDPGNPGGPQNGQPRPDVLTHTEQGTGIGGGINITTVAIMAVVGWGIYTMFKD